MLRNFINRKQEKTTELKVRLLNLDSQIKKLEEQFELRIQYLDYILEQQLHNSYTTMESELKHIQKNFSLLDQIVDQIWLKTDFHQLLTKYKQKVAELHDIPAKREMANQHFIDMKKIELKSFFQNIEGRRLDEQQQEAILKDELNNLVVAGAGSGKTTTIVGKVKYLIEQLGYHPEEILILSFTNKSAREMEQRLLKSISSQKLNVMTFHSLGVRIIKEKEGYDVAITQLRLDQFIKETFKSLLQQDHYRQRFNQFFISYLYEYKSPFEFSTLAEYINFLADKKMQTLKKEKLRSLEEIEIANFLYLNGIEYQYEMQYKPITQSYKPDFYLPEYDIYIEHFAVNKDGDVPPFFQGKNGLSAKDAYLSEMNWKRETHQKYSTILVESYSYDKLEGKLTDRLKEKLLKHGVKFNPQSGEKIFQQIINENKNELKQFISLMTGFLNFMRSNNVTFEEINQNLARMEFLNRQRTQCFIDLIEPIYRSYVLTLQQKNEIDFSDMINRALKYVEEIRYQSRFTYIIIDEYQDISLNRLNLIKALRNQTNAKVFCVGDDWQSIYRFAGSNVSLFTDFQKYMGYTALSKIESTYRYNQRIVNLSSEFVQQNPHQIKKLVQSVKPTPTLDVQKSVHLIYSVGDEGLRQELLKILLSLPHSANIYLLGRYTYDIIPYLGGKLKEMDRNKIRFYEREDLDIHFSTVHSSKGLESDYVILLNNKRGRNGFPSNIEDDPVYSVLRDGNEEFPYAEERRLFYVALTRTKNDIWLLVDSHEKSLFIQELEKRHGFVKEDLDEMGDRASFICPTCGGALIQRNSQYGAFYGCSNYPYCEYTQNIRSTKRRRINSQ